MVAWCYIVLGSGKSVCEPRYLYDLSYGHACAGVHAVVYMHVCALKHATCRRVTVQGCECLWVP